MGIENFALHVKWFIGSEREQAIPMAEVITSSFLLWLGVTMIGLLVTAVYNERLQQIGLVAAVHRGLDRLKPYVPLVLRIGLGAALLLQLATATYLAPELPADETWVWVALIAAFVGLIHRKLLPVSGLALAVLYANAVLEFGWFHALDYSFYLGIIYYLFVTNTRFKATATPVLYLLTGFSLAWVALEKLTMPVLTADIIERYGVPTFGFSTEHFVLISAFIELGLAWSFMLGILNRFVSILVTIVFILTTTVFGFKEIVGHTILHTLLIMFLIEGEGTFKTPFQFHRSPFLRYTFVLVNFNVMLFGLMQIYIAMAG